MYKIIFPLLGFESTTEAELIEQDQYFSIIALKNEAEIKMHLVHIDYLNKIPLNFNIEEKFWKSLKSLKRRI